MLQQAFGRRCVFLFLQGQWPGPLSGDWMGLVIGAQASDPLRDPNTILATDTFAPLKRLCCKESSRVLQAAVNPLEGKLNGSGRRLLGHSSNQIQSGELPWIQSTNLCGISCQCVPVTCPHIVSESPTPLHPIIQRVVLTAQRAMGVRVW